MKIAIKNNLIIATTVISENAFPDCEFVEVSEELRETINSYIKPMWNGSEAYEGVTPEEIAEQELEKQKILKQQQYEELLETDWYVVRFVETGVKIPEEILQQRQEIRNKYK